jgi:hypothetical protein
MNISEQLLEIQSKLKVPKGQYNDFGKYNYRSCEDILEASKPLLKEVGLTLTLDDKVEQVGTHAYIQATATLTNAEKQTIFNRGYARESETKKGMDDSQITGAASSYARKYALNGLFLIDDTKDADTNEYQEQVSKPEKVQSSKATTPTIGNLSETQAKQLWHAIKAKFGANANDMVKPLTGHDKLSEVPIARYDEIAKIIEAYKL